jgi:hypothetical protein
MATPLPILPVIDLLNGYFGIEDRDGLQEVGGKVTGGLLRLDRSLEPAVGPPACP